VVLEADRVRALAMILVAIRNGADGRGVAIHEAVTDRPTIYMAVIGAGTLITASLVNLASSQRCMMLNISAVPLGLALRDRGILWGLGINM
jgi:hypothetical protein